MILSVGCSKQPSTTGDDAQILEQIDAQLMASGQWRDPDTGLIWMRCSIGQTWTGKTCTGDLLRLNWQDAQDYVAQFTNADGGFAGHSDWRVPSIDELVTLRLCSTGWEQRIESRLTPEGRRDVAVGPETMTLPSGSSVPEGCAEGSREPMIDTQIFSNTPADSVYWSASPNAFNYNLAWLVYFGYGYMGYSGKYDNFHVRAVRAGQSVSKASAPVEVAATSAEPAVSVEAAATSAEPVISEAHSPRPLATDSQADQSLLTSGQWRDPATNMVWMRCSLGQTWTGSICTGVASKHNWLAAQDAVKAMNRNGGFGGHTDWVVPHIEDLASLIRCNTGFKLTDKIPAKIGGETTIQERCKDGYKLSTIDQSIFPNTSDDGYWSASPDAYDDNYAWLVGFDGGDTWLSDKGNNFHVRAVRAGQ